MIEYLELTLFHSAILIQASPLISIAHQKASKVYYSFPQKKGVTLNFTCDTEEFFNPKITKVEVTVEGVPNELYAQIMEYRHQYDEIVKHFAEGWLKEAVLVCLD